MRLRVLVPAVLGGLVGASAAQAPPFTRPKPVLAGHVTPGLVSAAERRPPLTG